MADRVVLAYSGGLDTSVGIGWLKDATGKDVVALAVDVGQGGEDMDAIRQRALDCGAVESIVIDAKDEFADDYLVPALKANALYQKRYPLVSALSRPLIAKHLALTAKQLGADSVAHGCTGKGNDQVRFEAAVAAIAPDLTSVAPVRDLALTRDKAIIYAQEHDLPILQSKKSPYSIDQNVWGRAVETGFLEDPWNAPIEDLYAYTQDPAIARDADEVTITFEQGIPVALDGQRFSVLRIVQELNALAGKHGVGRIDVVEDRLVGIKSREVYEAPAAMALIAAHEELESLTLERDVNRYKRGRRVGVGRPGLRRPLVRRPQALASTPSSTTPSSTSPATSACSCTAVARRSRVAAASSRCTTSTSRPTTPATRSTSRCRRASSRSGRSRARSRRAATWRTETGRVADRTVRHPHRMGHPLAPAGRPHPPPPRTARPSDANHHAPWSRSGPTIDTTQDSHDGRKRSLPARPAAHQGRRDQPGCPVGRPVRRRAEPGAGRPVEVDALRLAAGAVRPRRLARPRPGAAHGGVPVARRTRADARGPRPARCRARRRHRCCRPSPTRTCTAPSSAC